MLRSLLILLFVYLFARIVIGLFRGGRGRVSGGPKGDESFPGKSQEIEDADWEEIDEERRNSS